MTWVRFWRFVSRHLQESSLLKSKGLRTRRLSQTAIVATESCRRLFCLTDEHPAGPLQSHTSAWRSQVSFRGSHFYWVQLPLLTLSPRPFPTDYPWLFPSLLISFFLFNTLVLCLIQLHIKHLQEQGKEQQQILFWQKEKHFSKGTLDTKNPALRFLTSPPYLGKTNRPSVPNNMNQTFCLASVGYSPLVEDNSRYHTEPTQHIDLYLLTGQHKALATSLPHYSLPSHTHPFVNWSPIISRIYFSLSPGQVQPLFPVLCH